MWLPSWEVLIVGYKIVTRKTDLFTRFLLSMMARCAIVLAVCFIAISHQKWELFNFQAHTQLSFRAGCKPEKRPNQLLFSAKNAPNFSGDTCRITKLLSGSPFSSDLGIYDTICLQRRVTPKPKGARCGWQAKKNNRSNSVGDFAVKYVNFPTYLEAKNLTTLYSIRPRVGFLLWSSSFWVRSELVWGRCNQIDCHDNNFSQRQTVLVRLGLLRTWG